MVKPDSKPENNLQDYYLLAAATEMEKRLDEIEKNAKKDEEKLTPKPIKPIAQFLKQAKERGVRNSTEQKFEKKDKQNDSLRGSQIFSARRQN